MYLCAVYFGIRRLLIIFHCDIGLLGVCQTEVRLALHLGSFSNDDGDSNEEAIRV